MCQIRVTQKDLYALDIAMERATLLPTYDSKWTHEDGSLALYGKTKEHVSNFLKRQHKFSSKVRDQNWYKKCLDFFNKENNRPAQTNYFPLILTTKVKHRMCFKESDLTGAARYLKAKTLKFIKKFWYLIQQLFCKQRDRKTYERLMATASFDFLFQTLILQHHDTDGHEFSDSTKQLSQSNIETSERIYKLREEFGQEMSRALRHMGADFTGFYTRYIKAFYENGVEKTQLPSDSADQFYKEYEILKSNRLNDKPGCPSQTVIEGFKKRKLQILP
ncbi:MAG: hypothetical protein MRY21_07580 [Simkaniaceae bacterium]|nr:hypothetical protein [Simkaniaceae bacterium]